MMLKEVEGLWHKEFCGASIVEVFSWSGIELPGGERQYQQPVQRKTAITPSKSMPNT
jgi:hypothetical protein